MNKEQNKTFVMDQLKAGVSVKDIVIQLHTAQWSNSAIEEAFAAARQELSPAPETLISQPAAEPTTPSLSGEMAALIQEDSATNTVSEASPSLHQQPAAATAATLPPSSGRGSFKTGLALFMQSIRFMRNNPGLLRYAAMSTAWSLLLAIVVAVVAIFDSSSNQLLFLKTHDYSSRSSIEPTSLGLVLLVVMAYVISSIVAFYGVAISSHTLAIFRGKPGTYKDHIAKARKKLPAILVFALINTVVGYILGFLEQRLRILGWIVSKIFGILWKLATSFVLPVIADSDVSGTKAIRNSITLFKSNWGETVTGRVAAGGAVMSLYFLLAFPIALVLLILLAPLLGAIGVLITIMLLLFGFLCLAVISSFADSIVTTSLYYYATYRAIPPSYSPELLADVFKEKKSKK